MTGEVKVVPANEASCEDLQTVFGTRGAAASCQKIHVGTPQVFAGAGLAEIHRSSVRRIVMRIDF